MAKLVHSAHWMTEHEGEKHECRYACGAAHLDAPGRIRTKHTEDPAKVTCDACKHAVKERNA